MSGYRYSESDRVRAPDRVRCAVRLVTQAILGETCEGKAPVNMMELPCLPLLWGAVCLFEVLVVIGPNAPHLLLIKTIFPKIVS